jgi:hypothetical protein
MGTARFSLDPDKVHRGQRRDGEPRGTARFSVDPDKVHRGQRRDGEPKGTARTREVGCGSVLDTYKLDRSLQVAKQKSF